MLYAILAMTIWATTAIQIREINFDSQATLIFWSNIIAIIPAFFILSKSYKENLKIFAQYKFVLISVGLLAVVNAFTFFRAIQITTIANALITHYTTPVIVAAAAPFFLKERYNLKIVFSLILSIIGLIIILDMNSLRLENNDFIGCIYGLISALAYAAVIIIGRFFKANINPFVYSASQSAAAVIIFLPFADLHFFSFPNSSIFYLFTFSIFNILAGAFLFFKALTKINAATVAIIGYIEPLGAIFLSVILYNEPMTIKIITGGFLILFSALIVNLRK